MADLGDDQPGLTAPAEAEDDPPSAPPPTKKRKKAKAKAKSGKASKGKNATFSLAADLAALANMSEEEKRKRLIAMLKADLAEAKEAADPDWTMPTMTSDGRTAEAGANFRFDTRAYDLTLSGEGGFQRLAKACRLLFALDGSNWMPAGGTPQCLAERVALDVFKQHTKNATFDPETSGAEWWAQVRENGHKEEAIQFHWDTDEAAVEGHNVNVHPHCSTVTYLTAIGAPTLIVDRRNSLRPDDVEPARGPIRSGQLSYPSVGKHIVFDGQLLHGTVPRSCGAEAGQERVTFLVNVWLNHRPSNCHRVDDSLAERLGPEAEGHVTFSGEHTMEEVEMPSSVDDANVDKLEVQFSRCEGIPEEDVARHRLLLSLPRPPAELRTKPGATQLLRWPESSGVGLWKASDEQAKV